MRILVIGASGYIASRAIPALLDAGHDVIAAARTPKKLDGFFWRENVEVRQLDVSDESSVAKSITDDVDGILYLVHGLAANGFRDTDRHAAKLVQRAADRAGVERLVYISGIIPTVPRGQLSEHLKSRLEVEEALSEIDGVAVTLRAAMIVGAGSTSYALMSQLARRLPITVMPQWMNHRVEPLAVTDLVPAIVGAFVADNPLPYYDIGGGLTLPYPDLVARYLRSSDIDHPVVQLRGLPESLVANAAARIADVPGPTACALIESLREDMVAADSRWIGDLVDASYQPTGLAEAFERIRADIDFAKPASQRDPLSALPGDPQWAR